MVLFSFIAAILVMKLPNPLYAVRCAFSKINMMTTHRQLLVYTTTPTTGSTIAMGNDMPLQMRISKFCPL
jgi:hypothetical protein